jgi:hypothetical protein
VTRAERGWPLDARMRGAIRDEYQDQPGLVRAAIIAGTERLLGREAATGVDVAHLPWVEYRSLVWRCAAEAAGEAGVLGGR